MRASQRIEETTRLARELSDLLNLGFPLGEGLLKLASSATPEFKTCLEKLARDVGSGETLSRALKSNPGPFPQTFVRALSASETDENLIESLSRTAELLEQAQLRRASWALAMVYPQVVLIAGVFLGWVLFGYVGRTFAELFSKMSLTLPLGTRVFLLLHRLFDSPFTLVFLLAVCLAVWALLSGRPGWDGLRMRLPLLGPWLSRHQAVLLLSWTDHLLKSGLTLAEALRVSGGVCGHAYQSLSERVAGRVEQGDTMTGALEKEEFFPTLGLALVSHAEETEFENLDRVPRVLNLELERTYTRGMGVVEPLAIVIIGMVVGFVVISVFLPLYQLIGNLG